MDKFGSNEYVVMDIFAHDAHDEDRLCLANKMIDMDVDLALKDFRENCIDNIIKYYLIRYILVA